LLFLAFGALFLILWGIFFPLLPLLRRTGAIAARLMARASLRYARVERLTDRYRAYLPIALMVIAGGLLTAWAGDGFIDLAESVHANSPRVQDIDTVIHAWAVSRRTPDATAFFALMSIIGGPPALVVISVCVGIVLAIKRRWPWLLYLAITAGGGSLLNGELKRFFARARPDLAEMLHQEHGYSFPSGHAMGSTVVFGALSYLAFRAAQRWRWKAAALALACTLIAAVSLSRVYLGVHWISDVGAGIAAGALWVGVTTVGYETLRRIRMLRAMSSRSAEPAEEFPK
jgi:membrane-associated phospholipid phosphatase